MVRALSRGSRKKLCRDCCRCRVLKPVLNITTQDSSSESVTSNSRCIGESESVTTGTLLAGVTEDLTMTVFSRVVLVLVRAPR